MNVQVRLRSADAQRALRQLRARAPQAIARALNRAIVSARVVMTQAVAKDMGLKQADVKTALSVHEAKPGVERAVLVAKGLRLPLMKFGAKGPVPSRGRGRGVTYRIGNRGRGRAPNAFVATMRSGHTGVFMRKATARLPIRELRGPSVVHVFRQHLDVGKARGGEALVKNLQSEFRFVLRG